MSQAAANIHQFPLLQRAEVMTITPEIAAGFLSANTNNRPQRRSHIEALAHSISRGEWVVSHQGIAFSTQGVLLDGQHRLAAVVMAGIPVQMMVTTGVDEAAFKVLDCGIRRSLSDLTQLPRKTAEVCSLIAYTLKYGYGGSAGYGVSPALVLCVANSGISTVCDRLHEHSSSCAKYFSSRSMRTAAVLSVLDGADEAYVFGLYTDLCNGNVSDLPPIAQNLVMHVLKGRARANDSNLINLWRGLEVFDVQSKDKKRLAIREDTPKQVVLRVQRIMAAHGVEL